MKKIIALGLAFLAPVFAMAEDVVVETGTFDYIIGKVLAWIQWIVPVLLTLAIGYFIWGVIQFMTSSDEEAKKLGRLRIINGLIGLFVIVAFWGVIRLVTKTFGISGNGIAPTDSLMYVPPVIK